MAYIIPRWRAALGAAVFGCVSTVAAPAQEIIVGAATAQTGYLAPYDQPSLAGLRMAIDEINAKGGLAGKYKVNLMIKDTRTDTAQTVTVAQELIDAQGKVSALLSEMSRKSADPKP